ncbi:MAG TPA: DNA primase [Bacteroidales bacterium]|nr:DNA primase [Bacteroidales bacterium]
MIRKETIQNILDAAKIDEVVGEFVSLKKRGVNYIGLCPFHNEKTPSFTVSPAKGFFHCFGCGKGGGPVDFIMEHEHMSYPDALKYLAGKYNIEIADTVQTEEEKIMQSELEALYNLVAYAQKHFTDNLHNTEGGRAIGLSYFNERGFSPSVIKKFQLGFSPASWDDFTKNALENGYKKEYLVKTGLSIQKDDGTLYDRFRDRVIFPFHNLSGRVIGFTSRILTSDKNKPKYVNSPESEIYNKSRALYGIFLAKTAIISNENCYLVEGNTDVISLFQAGVENVVASSGTALTTEQIRLIKKFTNNITILYDGDAAGLKASLRGVDMILEEGLNVKVVIFPENEDPDSYARKHDAIEIKKFIKEGATNFIIFKAKLLLEESKNDPIKRAELIKEIVRTISLIPEPIHRSVYIKECSEVMKIQEQSLINELNKQMRKKIKKDVSRFEDREDDDTLIPEPTDYSAEKQLLEEPYEIKSYEKYLLWIILNYGGLELLTENEIPDSPGHTETVPVSVADYISQILANDDFKFSTAEYQQIYDEYLENISKTEGADMQYFITHPKENISKIVIEILSQKYELSRYWHDKYKISTPRHEDEDRTILTNDISKTINTINLKIVGKEMAEIHEQIKKMQKEEPDNTDIMMLLAKYNKKQMIMSKISSRLGIVINKLF